MCDAFDHKMNKPLRLNGLTMCPPPPGFFLAVLKQFTIG